MGALKHATTLMLHDASVTSAGAVAAAQSAAQQQHVTVSSVLTALGGLLDVCARLVSQRLLHCEESYPLNAASSPSSSLPAGPSDTSVRTGGAGSATGTGAGAGDNTAPNTMSAAAAHDAAANLRAHLISVRHSCFTMIVWLNALP